MTEAAITQAQQRLDLLSAPPWPRYSVAWYARHARWWRLEAHRWYPSSAESLRYYANLRWAAERVRIHGPRPWAELVELARAVSPPTTPPSEDA